DSAGKWSASTTAPLHQWTFVSAFDVNTKCDQRRTDRLANAAGDLGVDAESDRPGTKLGAIFDARRLSRCVSDDQFFTPPATGKAPRGARVGRHARPHRAWAGGPAAAFRPTPRSRIRGPVGGWVGAPPADDR